MRIYIIKYNLIIIRILYYNIESILNVKKIFTPRKNYFF